MDLVHFSWQYNGYSNTANGSNALSGNTTGYSKTANGYCALYDNTTGNSNTAMATMLFISIQREAIMLHLEKNAGYGASDVNFNQCTFVGANFIQQQLERSYNARLWNYERTMYRR